MELEEIKEFLLNTLEGKDIDKARLIYDNLDIYNKYSNYIFNFYSSYPNNDYAVYRSAYMYQHGMGIKQDYEKVIRLYERAVQLGNYKAMNNLAILYQNGQGIEQDYKKAVELYERSIKLGNSCAMNNLARMYKSGKGIEQNDEKAVELFLMAYNLGNEKSLDCICDILKRNNTLTIKFINKLTMIKIKLLTN